MADRINFAVSATPLETLAAENTPTGDTDIIASEVGKSLGGSGDSVSLTNYGNAASTQGYLNAAPYYIDAIHTAGGTQIVSGIKDFVFIKNTGFFYSSSTALGTASTHAVLVVIKEVAYDSGVDGGYQNVSGTPEDHFYEIAYLKPEQAIVLPVGSGITQFGSNANDISQLGSTEQTGQAKIFVKTVAAPGGASPADGNAVEFLAVT